MAIEKVWNPARPDKVLGDDNPPLRWTNTRRARTPYHDSNRQISHPGVAWIHNHTGLIRVTDRELFPLRTGRPLLASLLPTSEMGEPLRETARSGLNQIKRRTRWPTRRAVTLHFNPLKGAVRVASVVGHLVTQDNIGQEDVSKAPTLVEDGSAFSRFRPYANRHQIGTPPEAIRQPSQPPTDPHAVCTATTPTLSLRRCRCCTGVVYQQPQLSDAEAVVALHLQIVDRLDDSTRRIPQDRLAASPC
jgi:hypothetical protein